jgi:hypothetical protein
MGEIAGRAGRAKIEGAAHQSDARGRVLFDAAAAHDHRPERPHRLGVAGVDALLQRGGDLPLVDRDVFAVAQPIVDVARRAGLAVFGGARHPGDSGVAIARQPVAGQQRQRQTVLGVRASGERALHLVERVARDRAQRPDEADERQGPIGRVEMLRGIVADEGGAVVRDDPEQPANHRGDERRKRAHPLHCAPPQSAPRSRQYGLRGAQSQCCRGRDPAA